MLDTIWGFIYHLALFFVSGDAFMIKLRLDGMSEWQVIFRWWPVAIVGILSYFGFLKVITEIVYKYLKKIPQLRDFLAFFKKRQRKNHRRRKKVAVFIVVKVGHYFDFGNFPLLILFLVFSANLAPVPYLTFITVIVVGLIKEIKRGLVVIILANILKPPFLFFGVPWLYHLVF